MLKTLTTATILAASAGLAGAAPLPAPPTKAYTPAPQLSCDSETLHIYFPEGTSALTPAARAVFETLQARLDGCILGEVSLRASAADARNDAESERLSSARLAAVASALETYELEGMRVSATPDSEGPDALWTPMNRKVEIRFTDWSPVIS